MSSIPFPSNISTKSDPLITQEVSESIDRIMAEYGGPAMEAEEPVGGGIDWQETLFTVEGRDRALRNGMYIYDLGASREVCKPYEPVSPVFGEKGAVVSQSPVLSGAALEEYNDDRMRVGMPDAPRGFIPWEEKERQEALAKAADGYFAEANELVKREAADRTEFKLMIGGRVEHLRHLMHSDEELVQSFAREIARLQEAMGSSEKPETFPPVIVRMEEKLVERHEALKARGEKVEALLRELHAECDPKKGRIHVRGVQARHALAEKALGRFLPWEFDVEALGAFDEKKYRVMAGDYEGFVNVAREKCLDYWLASQEIWRRAMCLLYGLRVNVWAKGGALEGEMKPMPAAFGRRVSDDMYRACLAMAGSLTKVRGAMVEVTMTAGALRQEDFANEEGKERKAEATLVPLVLAAAQKFPLNYVLRGLLEDSERAMHLSGQMVKMLKDGLLCAELADWLLGAVHGMMGHLAAYAKESCMEHEFEKGVYGAFGVEYGVKYWDDSMDEMVAEAMAEDLVAAEAVAGAAAEAAAGAEALPCKRKDYAAA